MRSRLEAEHPSGFSVLVLTGFVVAAFVLLLLQIGLPLLLGPGGLLLVVVLDVGLYVSIRRNRIRRTRPPSRIVWGRVRKEWRVRRRDALETQIAVGFVLGAFLAVVYAVGVAIRIEYWWINPNIPLYIVGSVITFLAFEVMLGLGPDRWQTESERFDTTEDH